MKEGTDAILADEFHSLINFYPRNVVLVLLKIRDDLNIFIHLWSKFSAGLTAALYVIMISV